MLIDGEDNASRYVRSVLRKTVRRSPKQPSLFPMGESGSYQVSARLTDHFMQEHYLECAFRGCYLKFADFNTLAEHVQEAHIPPNERGGVTKPWIDDNDREAEEMSLPQPGGGKQTGQRESGGQASGRPKPSVPFIKVEDLKSDPVTAKILAVQSQNTGFNDVIVKIAVNGRSYFLGLKASNANYETLFKAFGSDDTAWVGETFTIGLNWNEFYEKNFVHIFEAGGEEKGARKKR